VGECRELESPLEHHSYPTILDYRRKFARYTEIEARALEPSLLAYLQACLLAPVRCCWFVFATGGLASGWRGLYVCAASAAYPVAVRRKALARGSSREPQPS
jgi:hypothetical protein